MWPLSSYTTYNIGVLFIIMVFNLVICLIVSWHEAKKLVKTIYWKIIYSNVIVRDAKKRILMPNQKSQIVPTNQKTRRKKKNRLPRKTDEFIPPYKNIFLEWAKIILFYKRIVIKYLITFNIRQKQNMFIRISSHVAVNMIRFYFSDCNMLSRSGLWDLLSQKKRFRKWWSVGHDFGKPQTPPLLMGLKWILISSFKGSSDPSHFIFEINVGNSRIRHRTTLNLNI